jgi:transcriptional regulator with XRE-family HTH domain
MHIPFGKRLRILRDEKKLNQEEIAKLTGVDRSAVAKWETATSIPNAETLDQLATYLDVSVDYLLGRTDTRQERRKTNRREFLVVKEEDDETPKRRMIGPELAFSSNIEAAVKEAGVRFDSDVLESLNEAPPGDVAAIMGLAPEEKTLKRIQIQDIDGVPSRIITSWLPVDLFANIVDRRGKPFGKSLFERLEKAKGIYAVKVEERIRTSNMTAEVAKLLHTNPGACALEIQRVVYADTGRVLEVSLITAVGQLWELSYTYAAGGRINAPGWSWMEHTPSVAKS